MSYTESELCELLFAADHAADAMRLQAELIQERSEPVPAGTLAFMLLMDDIDKLRCLARRIDAAMKPFLKTTIEGIDNVADSTQAR